MTLFQELFCIFALILNHLLYFVTFTSVCRMNIYYRLCILILLLSIGSDIYIWYQFLSGMEQPLKWLHWLPTTVLIYSIIIFIKDGYRNIPRKLTFAVVFIFLLSKLLFTLCSVAGFLFHQPTWGNHIGILFSLLIIISYIFGSTIGWRIIRVKEITLYLPDLPPSFDGYTISQLSDLHIGTYNKATNFISKIVNKANALNADSIVFTGDLINAHPSEVDNYVDILSNLKARDGIISILGNHDYCYDVTDSAPVRDTKLNLLIEREKELGWIVLLNSHYTINRGNDSIDIIGLEYNGDHDFPSRANLDQALEGTHSKFKIMLCHNPIYWRKEILCKTDIQLTLSGHVHGSHIRIGKVAPMRLLHREWIGLYGNPSQKLYVCEGIGGLIPFRLGAWPEITHITLKFKL